MGPSREIEVKLPVRDLPEILGRLRAMGGRRTGRVYERNTLFDTEDHYFERQQSILRIRVEEDADALRPAGPSKPRGIVREGILTFKSPVEGTRKSRQGVPTRYKERTEIEYRLADVGRFAQLLKRLGLRPCFQYEKYRSRYRFTGSSLHVELDETPVGIFLELEGSRGSIDRVAKALGYSARDYITVSYLELYAAECSRRGVPVANMVFSAKKSANSRSLRLTKFRSALNK